MYNAVIIRTDGSKEVVEFDQDSSYNVISTAVGGLIECVTLHDKEGVDMWVNERGKVEGLDQNPIATALWVDMYDLTDVIVGDVIVTGGSDEEGFTLGLTDEQVKTFMAYDRTIWNTAAPGFISFA
jgi:hypothetical protein